MITSENRCDRSVNLLLKHELGCFLDDLSREWGEGNFKRCFAMAGEE